MNPIHHGRSSAAAARALLPIPMSREEMRQRGWDALDVLLVSGDAYVDHPSFGIAIIARLLEREGYRVGIVAQPRFADARAAIEDLSRLGRPELFVGISSGVVDSMLNHYTANRRKRSDDTYSPGGRAGGRPDYATTVYTRLVKQAFPGVPVVLGGVEASLRRLAHYDYWQNRVRPSVLVDSDADLLVFGMGERQVKAVAAAFKHAHGRGEPSAAALHRLRAERGVSFVAERGWAASVENALRLPSFEEVRDDKKKFARATLLTLGETNPYIGRAIVQNHGSRSVVVNPPAMPLETAEMDDVYALPFSRQAHPSYVERIPADEMIRFSVTANRGCFGGCSFCALTLHQGRFVQSRSEESVLREIESLNGVPNFTGIVSDVGGPTANMYRLSCRKPECQRTCRKLSCLSPSICGNLDTDHAPQIRLLRRARQLPGVRKVLIASGLRFDLALRDPAYLRELVAHHVGGHLKVAPEHSDPSVLKLMKKPSFDVFCHFKTEFERLSEQAGKEQYLVPYFISGFPGCTEEKMNRLKQWLVREGWKLQQVQAFIPTPMTLATAIYWSGFDPETRLPVFVARDITARKTQQALLQPHRSGPRKAFRRNRIRKSPST